MKRLVVVLFLLAALLVGCVPAEPVVVEKPVIVEKEVVVEVEKEVVVEKLVEYVNREIVIAVPQEPPHLDAKDAYSQFSDFVMLNIVEPLAQWEPGKGMKPILATSWERIEPDVWRFHLRKGVKFSNGVPFNAENVAWILDESNNPPTGGAYPFREGPVGSTVVDEYTIDVKTPSVRPLAVSQVFSGISMFERKAYEADGTKSLPMGTGPYMLESWRHGESIVLVANPNWWGGEVDFQKVTFVFRAEEAVRAAMQAVGEADIAAWITPQHAGPIRTVSGNLMETMFMFYDPTPPLDDIRVRRAICMSMDRDVITNEILGGYATPANMLCSSDCQGYNPDIPVFPYDPERAKELLAEARADGVPVDEEITIIGRVGIYPHATETMEALQLWMVDIGLNVKLDMKEKSAWREANLAMPVPEGRVSIIQSCGSSGSDCQGPINGYYGCSVGNGYNQNCEGVDSFSRRPVLDPRIPELIAEFLPLAYEEGRVEAMQEAYAVAHETLWACPMAWPQSLMGVSERIEWTPRPDMAILVKDMKLR